MDKEPSTPPSQSLGLFRRATLQARIDALAARELDQPAPAQPPSAAEPSGAMARTG